MVNTHDQLTNVEDRYHMLRNTIELAIEHGSFIVFAAGFDQVDSKSKMVMSMYNLIEALRFLTESKTEYDINKGK